MGAAAADSRFSNRGKGRVGGTKKSSKRVQTGEPN
jgi:hypothetical protein